MGRKTTAAPYPSQQPALDLTRVPDAVRATILVGQRADTATLLVDPFAGITYGTFEFAACIPLDPNQISSIHPNDIALNQWSKDRTLLAKGTAFTNELIKAAEAVLFHSFAGQGIHTITAALMKKAREDKIYKVKNDDTLRIEIRSAVLKSFPKSIIKGAHAYVLNSVNKEFTFIRAQIKAARKANAKIDDAALAKSVTENVLKSFPDGITKANQNLITKVIAEINPEEAAISRIIDMWNVTVNLTVGRVATDLPTLAGEFAATLAKEFLEDYPNGINPDFVLSILERINTLPEIELIVKSLIEVHKKHKTGEKTYESDPKVSAREIVSDIIRKFPQGLIQKGGLALLIQITEEIEARGRNIFKFGLLRIEDVIEHINPFSVLTAVLESQATQITPLTLTNAQQAYGQYYGALFVGLAESVEDQFENKWKTIDPQDKSEAVTEKTEKNKSVPPANTDGQEQPHNGNTIKHKTLEEIIQDLYDFIKKNENFQRWIGNIINTNAEDPAKNKDFLDFLYNVFYTELPSQNGEPQFLIHIIIDRLHQTDNDSNLYNAHERKLAQKITNTLFSKIIAKDFTNTATEKKTRHIIPDNLFENFKAAVAAKDSQIAKDYVESSNAERAILLKRLNKLARRGGLKIENAGSEYVIKEIAAPNSKTKFISTVLTDTIKEINTTYGLSKKGGSATLARYPDRAELARTSASITQAISNTEIKTKLEEHQQDWIPQWFRVYIIESIKDVFKGLREKVAPRPGDEFDTAVKQKDSNVIKALSKSGKALYRIGQVYPFITTRCRPEAANTEHQEALKPLFSPLVSIR